MIFQLFWLEEPYLFFKNEKLDYLSPYNQLLKVLDQNFKSRIFETLIEAKTYKTKMVELKAYIKYPKIEAYIEDLMTKRLKMDTNNK